MGGYGETLDKITNQYENLPNAPTRRYWKNMQDLNIVTDTKNLPAPARKSKGNRNTSQNTKDTTTETQTLSLTLGNSSLSEKLEKMEKPTAQTVVPMEEHYRKDMDRIVSSFSHQ